MKEKKGVALAYNGDIPRIVALAKGKLLEHLIELARKHDIAVYNDPDMAEVLSLLPVGSEIPEDLYKAVSEILAYCYTSNAHFKEKLDTMGM